MALSLAHSVPSRLLHLSGGQPTNPLVSIDGLPIKQVGIGRVLDSFQIDLGAGTPRVSGLSEDRLTVVSGNLNRTNVGACVRLLERLAEETQDLEHTEMGAPIVATAGRWLVQRKPKVQINESGEIEYQTLGGDPEQPVEPMILSGPNGKSLCYTRLGAPFGDHSILDINETITHPSENGSIGIRQYMIIQGARVLFGFNNVTWVDDAISNFSRRFGLSQFKEKAVQPIMSKIAEQIMTSGQYDINDLGETFPTWFVGGHMEGLGLRYLQSRKFITDHPGLPQNVPMVTITGNARPSLAGAEFMDILGAGEMAMIEVQMLSPIVSDSFPMSEGLLQFFEQSSF